MVSFVALYRGKSLADSELVGVSNDPHLVGEVASTILQNQRPSSDPAMAAVSDGKRRALQIIKNESQVSR
jgi:hypothetical protein